MPDLYLVHNITPVKTGSPPFRRMFCVRGQEASQNVLSSVSIMLNHAVSPQLVSLPRHTPKHLWFCSKHFSPASTSPSRRPLKSASHPLRLLWILLNYAPPSVLPGLGGSRVAGVLR